MQNYDPVDLAYVAGIVDGEGTIGISVTRPQGNRVSPYFRTYCAVVMTDPNVPYFMYELFGGSIGTYAGRQSQHKATIHWRSSGRITYEVCQLVLPYLKVKRNQAKLVIDFTERVRNCTTRAMPPDELAERMEYVQKIHLLNKRGT